jgi:hypothetical protein
MQPETELPASQPPKAQEPPTELPWYIAWFRREKATMKGAPFSFVSCVIICTVLLGIGIYKFMDRLYVAEINGKNASIQAEQSKVQQLEYVKDMVFSLTNSYQNLDVSLKSIAISSSNSQPIIQFYIEQAKVLKSQLDIKTTENGDLKKQLFSFTDRQRLPNLLGWWAFCEFTNRNYTGLDQLIEACLGSAETLRRIDFTKSGMEVIHLANGYKINQTLDGEKQFENALDKLTDAHVSESDEALDECVYLGLIKQFMPASLVPVINKNYSKAWGYYKHLNP